MKTLKNFLHIWITLASVLSFAGGWAVFSHTSKPAVLFSWLNTPAAQSATSLSPVPSLDSLITDTTSTQPTTLQSLPSLQVSAQSSTAMLRTRGS